MSHPLVLALFDDVREAAQGAEAVHDLGVTRERLSIVARDHDEQERLAIRFDGSPGADIEDWRPAGRLGELGARVLAAIALVLPGVGPIVAGGPLRAALGEAAGHVAGEMAGQIASVLEQAGMDEGGARRWQERVHAGAVLLGVHAAPGDEDAVSAALTRAGATETVHARWGY